MKTDVGLRLLQKKLGVANELPGRWILHLLSHVSQISPLKGYIILIVHMGARVCALVGIIKGLVRWKGTS